MYLFRKEPGWKCDMSNSLSFDCIKKLSGGFVPTIKRSVFFKNISFASHHNRSQLFITIYVHKKTFDGTDMVTTTVHRKYGYSVPLSNTGIHAIRCKPTVTSYHRLSTHVAMKGQILKTTNQLDIDTWHQWPWHSSRYRSNQRTSWQKSGLSEVLCKFIFQIAC